MHTTYAFLRAVNLGATRKFPAADIKRVAATLGLADAKTHAASGNLFFRSEQAQDRAELETALEGAFAADRGFEVPTITFTPEEFASIAADARELAESSGELARHYIYLLKSELHAATLSEVHALANDSGRMVVRGRAAHALLYPGYQDGVVDPLNAAKLLGVATNRNANVVQLLTERWGAEAS